jgi:hypothetical protein
MEISESDGLNIKPVSLPNDKVVGDSTSRFKGEDMSYIKINKALI